MPIIRQAADLQRLVSQGESDKIEFKLRTPPEGILAAELTAFANAQGGTLIIGVDNHGRVVGLEPAEAATTEQRLRRIARSLLPFSTDVGSAQLAGRTVVYASVPAVPTHLGPIVTSTGETYLRQGSVSRRLSRAEEARALGGTRTTPEPGRRVKIFVAMSFRQEEEPALVDYFRAMQRAADATTLPLDLERMDLVEGDYEISQKIMDRISECDILIADFTLSSRNVYFELGFARGCGRHIIQTARKDTLLEFDVKTWKTVFYRNATEVEEKLRPALEAAYAGVTGQAQ